MNEITQKNTDFASIYNKSNRLAAAVFMVSNVMDKDEGLKTRIKNLSLELVSVSVNLKDISQSDAKKLITNLEKISFELMSMLDIASVSGLISKMNGEILKEEFQSFISELGKFSEKSEDNKNVSVRSIFTESLTINASADLERIDAGRSISKIGETYRNEQENAAGGGNGGKRNGNGHRRKDLRKNTVLEFIKRHDAVSIKDIMPNINGCSEKTIQRELTSLIKEGKIRKVGERRWSRYSII